MISSFNNTFVGCPSKGPSAEKTRDFVMVKARVWIKVRVCVRVCVRVGVRVRVCFEIANLRLGFVIGLGFVLGLGLVLGLG